MLYKTHKVVGILFGLIAFTEMQKHGMLSTGISPFVQLAIMYPAVSWGSTAPDLDHIPANIKEQTPENLVINRLLHIGKCVHRDWRTHSVYVTLPFCIAMYLLVVVLGYSMLNLIDLTILRLIITGITVGIVSHLFADALSTAGIWVLPGIKFRLVPHTSAFATGGAWEKFVQIVAYLAVFGFLLYQAWLTWHVQIGGILRALHIPGYQ